MATSTGLLGSTASTTTAATGDASKINDWYKAYMGRDAEAAGVDYYQKQIASGQSLQSIQDEIANSTEAKAYKKPVAAPAMVSATATGYKPTAVKVTPESTAAGQLASITANGSPLITQAETATKQAAAKSGLLNSSIAAGAGRQAVYNTAMPLAQQDATTNANAATTNAGQETAASQFLAGAQNSASQFNASQQNNASLQMALQKIQSDTTLSATDKQIASQQLIAQSQINSQQSIADKENTVKLQLQQIDAETKKSLATLDEGTKIKLQSLDAKDKQLLQTNISAANAYAQLAQALSAISTSTTMDAAAKQQASDNQIGLFRQSLQALGQVSGLDLSKYFEQVNTSAQGAATDTAAADADMSGRPGMSG